MLTLFRKLLGKQPAQQPTPTKRIVAHQEAAAPMPTVEVAHLSLAAIVARLPDELQALVRQQPDGAATVALPVHTIVKQLPSGSVKISLATLHRQAPAGVFAPLPPGDKRTVCVPLSEIFRHVSPVALKRRMDQRAANLPPSDFDLFGNAANPYEIAQPDENRTATLVIDEPLESAVTPRFAGSGARVIPPPADYLAPTPHRVAPAAAPQPAKPKSDLPPLRLPLAPLMAAWPDEIKGELAALNGSASVLLPVEEITAGLAKGKVIFTWGELRACIEPALESASAVDEATPLSLPLKVVAPAFLAASRQPKHATRTVEVAGDIPEMFSSGKVAAAPEPSVADDVPAAEAPLDVQEPAPVADAPLKFSLVSEDAPVEEPIAESAPVEDAVAEVDAAPSEEPALAFAPEVELAPEGEQAPEVEQVSEHAPEMEHVEAEVTAVEIPEAEIAAVDAAPECIAYPDPAEIEADQHPPAPASENAPATDAIPAATIGAIFGEPERQHWTPSDIVSRLPQLPGVAGAVVALQEGLLVAHSLPEDMKGDVVAAFLPQVFARLNQYAGEMNLGEVDDLLFTTRGAHCQIYRFGIVYFAILGKRGENLPWHELRIIAAELAKQTQLS